MSWQIQTNKKMLEALAIRLKDYRIRKHYTKKELAAKSGVSLNSVQRMEQGKSVSLSIFISVLRTLKLLNNLETLVPDVSVSPIEMLQQKGGKKQRVRKKESQ